MKKLILLITTLLLFTIASCAKTEDLYQLGDSFSITLDDNKECNIEFKERNDEYFTLVFSTNNKSLNKLIFDNLVGVDAVKVNDEFVEYIHYGGILPYHYYVIDINESRVTAIFYLEQTCNKDYKIKIYNAVKVPNLNQSLGDWYLNDSINIEVVI